MALLLLELVVSRVVQDHEVPRQAGRRALAEAVGVRKQGAELLDGQPVCLLIMDVRACSELMLSPGGDLDDAAVPSQLLPLLM